MLAAAAGAYQREEPTFRTTTRLVEVAVVAVNAAGAPVTDLKKSELILRESGAQQDIAFLQYDGGPPARPATLPKGMFSNRLEFSSGPARNVTALLVDSLNTPFVDQVRVRGQVARYLREMPADTRFAVYHLGRSLSIVHDFTQDPEALRDSLAAMKGEHQEREQTDVADMAKQFDNLLEKGIVPASSAKALADLLTAEAQMNARVKESRIRATIGALGALGGYLAEMPGRKNLVWVTGGLPLIMNVRGARGEELTSLQGLLREAAQRLAQSGVALYIVDARGIQAAPPPGPRGSISTALEVTAINEDIRLSSSMMAAITGGKFINYTNNASDGVREAVRDMAGAYTVGFYTGVEPDGRWHDISLEATRPGVKLRFRSGYIAEKQTPAAELGEADWRRLISSREPARGVAMKAFAERDPKTRSLMLQAYFDVGGIAFRGREGAMEAEVDSCLAEVSGGGRVRFQTDTAKLRLSPQEWKLVQTAGVPWARAWKPREDTVHIKLLVRDRTTGVHGAIDIPLDKVSP